MAASKAFRDIRELLSEAATAGIPRLFPLTSVQREPVHVVNDVLGHAKAPGRAQ
jgi:hypothetical protein